MAGRYGEHGRRERAAARPCPDREEPRDRSHNQEQDRGRERPALGEDRAALWSDRLRTAAITVYSVGVVVAFAIVAVRVVPPSALPTLSATALFLGLLGSLLLAIREAVHPDEE